jgi:phage-related protein
MVFENGVKNIQAAAYNGARTVYHASLKSFKFILHLARKHHTKAAKMAGCTGVGRSRQCARQYAGARRARGVRLLW